MSVQAAKFNVFYNEWRTAFDDWRIVADKEIVEAWRQQGKLIAERLINGISSGTWNRATPPGNQKQGRMAMERDIKRAIVPLTAKGFRDIRVKKKVQARRDGVNLDVERFGQTVERGGNLFLTPLGFSVGDDLPLQLLVRICDGDFRQQHSVALYPLAAGFDDGCFTTEDLQRVCIFTAGGINRGSGRQEFNGSGVGEPVGVSQFQRGLISIGNFDARLRSNSLGLVEIGTPDLFPFPKQDVFDNEVFVNRSTLQLC